MHRILVLHGPNLDALGSREPDLYGRDSLDDVNLRLQKLGHELGCQVECLQSQHEGVLIDELHRARGRCEAVVLNPGGLTHTSVALHDAIRAAGVPVIEVHLTNPSAREPFRQVSLTAAAATAVVQGFGAASYERALRGLAARWAS